MKLLETYGQQPEPAAETKPITAEYAPDSKTELQAIDETKAEEPETNNGEDAESEADSAVELQHAKPLFTIEEQIAHLKAKGVTFSLCTEDEAAEYLSDKTYYFKATAHRTLFQKCVGGERDGQYIELDFGHLKRLAAIDQQLRYALLPMTLDVEHFAKVKVVHEVTERRDEDGYTIVADYMASLNRGNRKRREDEISRLKSDAYSGALVKKYDSDMPIWVFVELLSFGAFINLYRFCADRWVSREMKDEHYLLRHAKDARNAYAHSSAVVNGFVGSNSRVITSPSVGRALAEAGLSKRVRTSKTRNVRLQQIAALLYAHTQLVTGESTREAACKRLAELETAMSTLRDELPGNDAIRSSFDFLITLFDKWF